MTGPALTALHTAPWVCEQTSHEDCVYCGAPPGRDCTCGPGAMHLARFVRACRAQRISARDVACLIPDSQPFTGATVVPAPAATT